jgi:hypothetical protein
MMFPPQGASKHSHSFLVGDKLEKDAIEMQRINSAIFDLGYGKKREKTAWGLGRKKKKIKKKKKLAGVKR